MALGHLVCITGRGGPAWFTLISSLTNTALSLHYPDLPLHLTPTGARSPSGGLGGGGYIPYANYLITFFSFPVGLHAGLCALMRQSEKGEGSDHLPNNKWTSTWFLSCFLCTCCQADWSVGPSSVWTIHQVSSQTVQPVWLFSYPLLTVKLTDMSEWWICSLAVDSSPPVDSMSYSRFCSWLSYG